MRILEILCTISRLTFIAIENVDRDDDDDVYDYDLNDDFDDLTLVINRQKITSN